VTWPDRDVEERLVELEMRANRARKATPPASGTGDPPPPGTLRGKWDDQVVRLMTEDFQKALRSWLKDMPPQEYDMHFSLSAGMFTFVMTADRKDLPTYDRDGTLISSVEIVHA
jgi:hypothetical protein